MIDIAAPLPCRDAPGLFTTPDGEHPLSDTGKARVREAKRLCTECPQIQPCREEARASRARGVWGGEDDADRARLRARIRRQTPRELPSDCGDVRGTIAGVSRHRKAGQKPCEACLEAERAYQGGRRAASRAAELAGAG